MITKAYFISPTGKIFDIDVSRHMSYVLRNPEKFGYTLDELKAIYIKNGERIGSEGRTREEVVEGMTRKGFIHIRHFGSFWAINLMNYDNRARRALSVWAEHIINEKIDRAGMCKIFSFKTNGYVDQKTVQELYFGIDENTMEKTNDTTPLDEAYEKWVAQNFHPKVVSSIDEFEDLNVVMEELKQISEGPVTLKSFSTYTTLKESSLARIFSRIQKYDYGLITAWRKGEDCGEGRPYSRVENLQRNKSLVAKLIYAGYSVTAVKGYETGNEHPEPSYMVIDHENKGTLEADLRKLGEFFEQDSIIYGKAGSVLPSLIGTNHCPNGWPGYGNKAPFDERKWGRTDHYFTRVKGRPFSYKNIDENLEVVKTYPTPKFPTERRSWKHWAELPWQEFKVD